MSDEAMDFSNLSEEEKLDLIQDELDVELNDSYSITMENTETGEEHVFYLMDDFMYENEVYAVLLNVEKDPEAVIAKLVGDENNRSFQTIVGDDFEKISKYYLKLVEEEEK